MKKIPLYILFLLGNISLMLSQNLKSVEIPRLKNNNMFFLGESNGNVFFYANELHKNNIKLTIYKYKSSNLELLESKEIVMNNFERKVFDNNKGSCRIEALYRNNRFYFFYSLIYSGDYHVYLKTLDENLNNEKTVQIGSILETGYELLGNFYISYSPDYKNALIVLKNFCEKKKVVGSNTEIYENTELINYDLTNDKIVFSKKLPLEIEGLRLKSEQYKLDIEGNVLCVAALAERKDGRSVIRSMAIGCIKNAKEEFTAMEIDLTGIKSVSTNLHHLKNGDFLLTMVSEGAIKAKYVSLKNPSRNYEKMTSSVNFKNDFYVDHIDESSKGFYLTLCKKGEKSFSDFYGYNFFGAAFISLEGELNWSKTLSTVNPFYYNSVTNAYSTSLVSKNKLHVFFLDQKSIELTPKEQKLLNDGITYRQYDFKKFNTMESVINEDGKIDMRIINTNEDFELNPSGSDHILYNESAYFVMSSPKSFMIKKIELK